MTPNYEFNDNHGGNLKEAEKIFGVPEEGWLDLSTGVNHGAYSNVELTRPSLKMLPQQERLETLLDAARVFYNVPKELDIIAAPGSQVLIQQLPSLSFHRRVSIVGPTYAEHARNWKEKGHRVNIVNGIEDINNAEIVIVVNPNNPNGRVVTCNDLLAIIDEKIEENGLLIIDEAFADAQPEASIIPHLTNASTIVLRSFGKFFGLPGLRLGFAVGPPYQINLLEKKLGPWAVSGPAIEIGTRALNDTQWIATTRIRLQERCKKLDAIFERSGIEILGGTSLFRLIEYDRAEMLFHHLGNFGIYVRRFSEYKSWLRIGIPDASSDFVRLEKALKSAL